MKYNTKSRGAQVQSLKELAALDTVYITPDQAAKALGCNGHTIRVMASTEEGRSALGFPVVRLGKRTKIPRIPFLRYLGLEGEINGATEEAYVA